MNSSDDPLRASGYEFGISSSLFGKVPLHPTRTAWPIIPLGKTASIRSCTHHPSLKCGRPRHIPQNVDPPRDIYKPIPRLWIPTLLSTPAQRNQPSWQAINLSSWPNNATGSMALMIDILERLPAFIRNAIMPAMLFPPVKNTSSKVQLERLSHVYFEHADLKQFGKFAHDFGFVEAARNGNTIYFRGYGISPYCYVASRSKDGKSRFLGAAFVAQNQEEFDKAKKIEGAEPRDLKHAPGGGQMITFARSDETFMHVVFGQQEREVETKELPTATHESLGPMNTPFEKPREGKCPSAENICRNIKLMTSRTISALPLWPSSRPQTWPLRLCMSRLRQ